MNVELVFDVIWHMEVPRLGLEEEREREGGISNTIEEELLFDVISHLKH